MVKVFQVISGVELERFQRWMNKEPKLPQGFSSYLRYYAYMKGLPVPEEVARLDRALNTV